jgi:hypothetical protein
MTMYLESLRLWMRRAGGGIVTDWEEMDLWPPLIPKAGEVRLEYVVRLSDIRGRISREPYCKEIFMEEYSW